MRSANRRTFLKSAGAASALGLAGCMGGGGESGNTINIGMVESRTGPFAAPGKRRIWATEAAVEHVNEEGGINGREIELHIEDTETDPGTATTKAQNLINDENVEMLCGTFSSSVALAVAPVAARNNIPYFAGYAATRRLTGKDCNSWTFRGHRNNAEIQWAGLGPYLLDQGYKSGSILYADYSWGQSERQYFEEYFSKQGGGEILSSVAAPAGTTDFSQYLANVDTSGDFLAFIQAGGDSINLLSDIGDFGIHEEVDLVTVGAGVGEFLEEGGVSEEVSNSLLGLNYYPKVLSGPLDTEGNRKFHEAYAKVADEPVPTRSSSTGWEAIWTMHEVASEVDYTGPDDAQAFVDGVRGFEMEESFRFPQGNKYYRAGDNQPMLNQYIFDNDGYTEKIVDTVPISVAEETKVTCEM